ncbi:hypothetical protein LCGC14_1070610 [marine sediment metagenome]|uniref:Phosphoribulokinase/uridine kinase domain-containing protein n=1 Tax=marine sediment metagenome TaxID=412755 RepID=A0A0F9QP62_9ZZZZ
MIKILGDKKIFKKEHFKIKDLILPKIIKKYYHCNMVVTIGGESGTGKTEVASLLQESLWENNRIRCKIIHEDDYYIVLWNERNKLRKKSGINSVGMNEIDWLKINKIVDDFKNEKKKLYVQRIHKYTNSIEYVITNSKYIDILIIEGLYTNNLDRKDFGIYLEGTYKDTKKFREERQKEVINNFRIKVLKQEHKEVLKTKKMSDLIIPFLNKVK